MITSLEDSELSTMSVSDLLRRFMDKPADQLAIGLEGVGEERVVDLLSNAVKYLCHDMPEEYRNAQGVDISNALVEVFTAFKIQGLNLSKLTPVYPCLFDSSTLSLKDYNLPILRFLLSNNVPINQYWLALQTKFPDQRYENPDLPSFISLLRQYDLYYPYQGCLVQNVYCRSYHQVAELDPAHRSAHFESQFNKNWKCSPLHFALLSNVNRDQIFEDGLRNGMVGLELLTQWASKEEPPEEPDAENLLHLAIRARRFKTARHILAVCKQQGVNLIDGRNAQGDTPLHYLAMLSSTEQIDADLMQQMIEYGPDLTAQNNQGQDLVCAFSQYAPNYLPQLLYFGHLASVYVAKRFANKVLAVAKACGEALVAPVDLAFVTTLTELLEDLQSASYAARAKIVFEHGETYFQTQECKQTLLCRALTESKQTSPQGVLAALFSLRNVTSLRHEAVYADAMWTPQYFTQWCSAWKTHSPEMKVNVFDALPAVMIYRVTGQFSLQDMVPLRLVNQKASQVVDACLYPPFVLDSIREHFPECSTKRAFERKQLNLNRIGERTIKAHIMALFEVVQLEDFSITPSDYYRFQAIVMNRLFSKPVPGSRWHRHINTNRYDMSQAHLVEDLLFIAAAMHRRYHFMALLQSSNGFGLSSNRITYVLAASGQLSLLKALSRYKTDFPHIDTERAAQYQVSWNGEPDEVGYHLSNPAQPDQTVFNLLPGEHVEEGEYVDQYGWLYMRFAAQSPLVASMMNEQQQVVMFLALHEAVKPSHEDIVCAKRLGYEQAYHCLLQKVDGLTRVQLLDNGTIEGRLDQNATNELIEILLQKLKPALQRAIDAYYKILRRSPSSNYAKSLLLMRWQGTYKQKFLKYRSYFDTQETDARELCDRMHELIHHEVFSNKDVRGSDFMRYVIEEIHQDLELCAAMNLRHMKGGAAIHDEIFNDHLPTIELKMPPSWAPKPGEKPSIAYRNFYRDYLRATITLWKNHLAAMMTDDEHHGAEDAGQARRRG